MVKTDKSNIPAFSRPEPLGSGADLGSVTLDNALRHRYGDFPYDKHEEPALRLAHHLAVLPLIHGTCTDLPALAPQQQLGAAMMQSELHDRLHDPVTERGAPFTLAHWLDQAKQAGAPADLPLNLTHLYTVGDTLNASHRLHALMSFAIIEQPIFNGTDASNSILFCATLNDGRLNNATFTQTDFTGAHISGTTATGCSFDHASFKSADLNDVTFERCSFKGTEFNDLHATGVTFKDCDLRALDMTQQQHLMQEGARFIDCQLPDLLINQRSAGDNVILAATRFGNASAPDGRVRGDSISHDKLTTPPDRQR